MKTKQKVNATRLGFAITGSNSPHAPSLRREIRLDIFKTVHGDHFAKITYTSEFEWEWAPKVTVIPPRSVVDDHDRMRGAWSLPTLVRELDTNVDSMDLSGLTCDGMAPADPDSDAFQDGKAHAAALWADVRNQVFSAFGFAPVIP